LSGGGAGLSQMLMCQMLTGTAWTKEMSRPTTSVGDKMVMLDQFPHRLSGILDGFVPATGRPLGHRRYATACCTKKGGCACRCIRGLGTGLITGFVTTTVDSRSQGRNGDWTDWVRRRREDSCRTAVAAESGHCCPVLSAQPRAPPCKLHHFHHNHSKPITQTSPGSSLR